MRNSYNCHCGEVGVTCSQPGHGRPATQDPIIAAFAPDTPFEKLRKAIGGPGINAEQIAQNEFDRLAARVRRETTVPVAPQPQPTRADYLKEQINKKEPR